MISEVYNTDCVEYMKTLPDGFFDLAVADPPYGIFSDKKRNLGGNVGKLSNRAMFQDAEKINKWDVVPEQIFFDELKRVSKNQVIWGGNYFPLPPTRCMVAWDKCQPWETFSQIELAWTSFDYPAKLFRFDNRTTDKIHPTQKPEALYGWCLKTFANKGDKIFDPMMGSGSSRIAAYKMGFDYWGCEIDSDYFQRLCDRFDAECKGVVLKSGTHTVIQQSLFDF